ncbi:hypothetical protein Tco_0459680 [Tanacetum coccineum]
MNPAVKVADGTVELLMVYGSLIYIVGLDCSCSCSVADRFVELLMVNGWVDDDGSVNIDNWFSSCLDTISSFARFCYNMYNIRSLEFGDNDASELEMALGTTKSQVGYVSSNDTNGEPERSFMNGLSSTIRYVVLLLPKVGSDCTSNRESNEEVKTGNMLN